MKEKRRPFRPIVQHVSDISVSTGVYSIDFFIREIVATNFTRLSNYLIQSEGHWQTF
jgi:hypothetical protein